MNEKILLLIAIALLYPLSALAENSDWMLWNRLSLQKTIPCLSDTTLLIDLHQRSADHMQKHERFIVRPSISTGINQNLIATFGYDFIPLYLTADFDEKHRNEHRTWEQLNYRQLTRNGQVNLRWRQEQRYIDKESEVSHRSRLQWGIAHPLDDHGALALNFTQEIFYTHNEVSAGPKQGYDRFRTVIGPSYTLANIRYDVGYLFEQVAHQNDFSAVMLGVTLLLD
jgi:Protein of unknown function (DUF2490)